MEVTKLVEKYDHPLYKHCEEKEAESIAWAFVNKEKMVRFPYKNTELLPNEIRANVLYAGLCLSDSLICREKMVPVYFPCAPGHEIIAEVAQIGSDVKDFKIGEKVGFGTMRDCCNECRWCKLDYEVLCSGVADKYTYMGQHWGGFSTTLQQPASHFFHLPSNLDLAKSAPLFCAGITVYSPISKYCKPGMNTAVIGIGGLGHLAVKFLSKLGYQVTGVTTSISKKEAIMKLGATDVLDITNDEAYKANISKFDFIINTIPAKEGFNKLVDLCGPLGKFIQVGIPDDGFNVEMSLMTLIFKGIQVIGSGVGSRSEINAMLKLCADEDIYPVNQEFEFEDFPKALDLLEHGKPIFRCTVNVGDFTKKKTLVNATQNLNI